MSKKTIEDKFISYQHEITTAFSVNDIVDKHGKEKYLKVHQNQFLSYKAGYETAQKEMIDRSKEAEELLSHVQYLPKLPESLQRYLAEVTRNYLKKWGVE